MKKYQLRKLDIVETKKNQLYKAVFDKQRLHRMIPKQHHNCSEKEDVTL